MTINITTSSILAEIKEKSRLEMQHVKDAEERYFLEAGTEKEDELKRAIMVGDTQLRSLLTKYLQTTPASEVTAGIATPATLVYVLGLSERRDANKSAQLPQLMRDYLVSSALSKHYATVSVTDSASKWANEAAALGAEILRIVLYKNPPVL